jgi:hypothetical protein
MENHKINCSVRGGTSLSFRQLLLGLGLVGAGMLVGAGTLPPSEAWGEVRATPPPKAFESGGQISVPILRDISATLHQMDARLSRMETVAKLLQAELLAEQHTQ